jgi:Short-chain dehydrogenases of various substrate specificities
MAIVRQLVSDGWTVYGGARRVDRMEELASLGVHTLPLDVTDDASMIEFVNAVLSAEGRIDALINNAGYGTYGPVEDVPLSEARNQFEVNTFGLVRMCQLVLPTMRKQRSGRIVNITSMGGKIWTPFGAWYHATKHAVEVISDALNFEVRPFGVQVVIVEPGHIATEWGGIAAKNLRDSLRQSVYKENGSVMADVLERGTGASSPDVIAKVVSRALKATRPRLRYAAPLDAKLSIFLHWLLPDWAWEKLIWAMVRGISRIN